MIHRVILSQDCSVNLGVKITLVSQCHLLPRGHSFLLFFFFYSYDLFECDSCTLTQTRRKKARMPSCVGQTNFGLKSGCCYSEPRRTFTVGVIIAQWAEAVLTDAAVSCLQVHAVGVLHAAVALWAEVMTCSRRASTKVETHRGDRSRGWRKGLVSGSFILCFVVFQLLSLLLAYLGKNTSSCSRH